jgi:hypothetical protein
MENPPRDPRIPDLVSLAEAAKIMRMTKQAAHKMVLKGQLRGARIGTTWVFRRVVVQRFHKAGTEEDED